MLDLISVYDIEKIFQAIRETPNLRFWLIGKGEDRQALEEKAKKLAVHDKVRFIDDIAPYHWQAYIKALDLCVVPCRRKGIDRLTLEAWSCGICVASGMPPDHSPITHRENGWLVENNDILKWREALSTLQQDKERRQEIGKAGMQKYRQSHDPARIIGTYLQSYEMSLRIKI